MTGDNRIKSKFKCAVEEGGELDSLVTAHAGVGRSAGRVLADEIVNDSFGELRTEVPHIKGDAQQSCCSARIERILNGAATA
jgi:hypothetical protein